MLKTISLCILILFSRITFSHDSSDAGLTYLNSLPNQKAACLSKIQNKYSPNQSNEEHMLKRKEELTACYKKIVLDVASKYYPSGHFGNDLEQELHHIIDKQQHLYDKMTHCPLSKNGSCEFYEDYDAASAMVDYLNEMIEFMVLNIGEGYSAFNPEAWLKKWDKVGK